MRPLIAPGDHLHEYELVAPLGAGGMGEVYLGWDHKLEREVALKILRVEPGEGRERLERFAGEARAASGLTHPNVAQVYGVGQEGDFCYIAMEYVHGQTLRGASLSAEEAIDAAVQVAGALEAAHEAGIIHRDIKPANLIRTERGLMKVLDFGLAKRLATGAGTGSQRTAPRRLAPAPSMELTEPGVVMGTLGYMSPEQILGEGVDHRTDVFSLGVVLYQLLSGKLPYGSGSYEAALAELTGAGSGGDPGDSLRGRIPNGVAEVVLRAIQRDPARRFQSAGEFASALRAAWRDSEKTEAAVTERIPKTEAAPPAPRRTRREWLAAAGAVAAVGGFAGFRFWREWQVPDGPVDSLAVLPFVAKGVDPETEYLREGIAEGVMNRLSNVKGLRVMSRDSSFRVSSMPAMAAGRHLGVRGVVAGAIQSVDKTLVVSAELVDAKSGDRLWGGEFQGATGEALQIRDAISASIAAKLELKLAGADEGATPARETASAQAHDFYLRGKYLASKLNADSVRKGIDYFTQAIEIDPGYALAHAGMAEAYLFSADLFAPAAQLLASARESAAFALQDDPKLAEGHVALGMVKIHADLDWAGAESSLRRAIELNGSLPTAHGFLGWVLAATGRSAEGLAANRQAVQLEPRSPLMRSLLAANLYFAGDYAGSFSEAGEALEADPQFHLALLWRGLSMIGRGLPGIVAGRLEQARKTSASPLILAALARAHAAGGNQDKARAALADLEQASRSEHVSPILFAQVHATLGDRKDALAWLDRAYESRAKLLMWAKLDPAFEGLRETGPFRDLMAKLHLG
ncbi:MAG: protein kinase [Bryobacteraceae bacterium]